MDVRAATRRATGCWCGPASGPRDGASATLDKVAPRRPACVQHRGAVPAGNYDAFGYLVAVHYHGNVPAALAVFERLSPMNDTDRPDVLRIIHSAPDAAARFREALKQLPLPIR